MGSLFERVNGLTSRPARATFEHGPGRAFYSVLPWNGHWVITHCIEGDIFQKSKWAVIVVKLDGDTAVETDRVVLDDVDLNRAFIFGDRLVLLIADSQTAFHYELYQSSRGKLKHSGTQPGDTASQLIWSNEHHLTALRDRLLFTQDRSTNELVVFELSPMFAARQVSRMLPTFGEKVKFTRNEGFSSIDVLGGRAVLGGPDSRTGFQLADVSNPKSLRTIAQVAGSANQPNIVRFTDADRFVAYGAHGSAQFFEFDRSKQKLVSHGMAKTQQYFTRLVPDGDEVLLYEGNLTREVGLVISCARAKPTIVGKVKFPFDVMHVVITDEVTVLLGEEQTAFYDTKRAPAKPKTKRK